MNDPIEAQSLSSLTALFANPPQYPRNPTHTVHEPLTLYIVRVPGSRDVFLSPIKPPTKASISLEAVQHSLYYLHVNTQEDELVKQAVDEQNRVEESARPSVTIPRKPVAVSNHPLPPIPQATQHEEVYRPPLPFRRNAHQSAENTALPLKLKTYDIGQQHEKSALYNPAGDYAVLPSPREQGYSSARSFQNEYSYMPRGLTAYENGLSSREPPFCPKITLHQPDVKFPLITIIRRDPTSGSQWNIGTITILESTFSASNVRPVCVELTSPGYGRFSKPGFETPRPDSAGTDAASIKRAMTSMTMSPASATTPVTPVTPFVRVVDFRKMALAELKRTVYQRTHSSDSLGRFDPSKSGIEKNVLAFTSPWQGTCTFVNAIDGKTLRLKHTIANNSSYGDSVTSNVAELRFNLGWSILSNIKDSHYRRKEAEPDKLPIPRLLENKRDKLRNSFQHLKERSRDTFQRSKSAERYDDMLRDISNIQTPTSNNLNDNDNEWLKTNTSDRYTNNYPRSYSTTRQNSSEDNDDDEHRLSLALGRERAGGGFRGHSAKLGKLVIEDEGLKMCDLVVGAAMGVWWQHYGG